MWQCEGAEGGWRRFVLFICNHVASSCLCDGCWDARFWYILNVFKGVVRWVVVRVVSFVGYNAIEGGAVFGNRSFGKEEDIWVVSGYEGNDVGV